MGKKAKDLIIFFLWIPIDHQFRFSRLDKAEISNPAQDPSRVTVTTTTHGAPVVSDVGSDMKIWHQNFWPPQSMNNLPPPSQWRSRPHIPMESIWFQLNIIGSFVRSIKFIEVIWPFSMHVFPPLLSGPSCYDSLPTQNSGKEDFGRKFKLKGDHHLVRGYPSTPKSFPSIGDNPKPQWMIWDFRWPLRRQSRACTEWCETLEWGPHL